MIQDNLRRLVKEREITVEQLAAKLQRAGHDVHFTTVYGWLRGRCAPNLNNARALAEVLGVTVDDLVAEPAERGNGGAA